MFFATASLAEVLPEKQNPGTIEGMVIDKTTPQPLIGANITIEKTSKGAASAMDGSYIIRKASWNL